MPTADGAEADSPWNPEEESSAGNPNARLLSQTRGVTNYATSLGMSACTACTPTGLRVSAACLEMSTHTACTPSWLVD